MKIEKTPLQDALLIQLNRFEDARGVFTVRHSEALFSELGFQVKFVQDNHSSSHPGVMRGLHFQIPPETQGKLISVIRGRIFDVIVDLRKNSPTFKKSYSIELSEKEGNALWVPSGFAHGFCVLGDSDADVLYKVDAPYAPKLESGIRFNDPTLGIHWPVKNLIVNDKDKTLPTLDEYLKNPIF